MRNWVAQFFRAFSYVFIDTKLVPYRFVLEKLMEPPCALGGLIFKNQNCPYSNLTVISPLNKLSHFHSQP